MKKFAFLAAAAALSMSAAAPALANSAENVRALSAVQSESELEGGANWLWLVAAIGAVVVGILISGDSDAPVSP
jgi:hypothetical protein